MPKFFVPALLAAVLASLSALAQSVKFRYKEPGKPAYFVDSVNVPAGDYLRLDSSRISTISIYQGRHAALLAGDHGKDGLVYVETRKFARERFQRLFASRSPRYRKLLEKSDGDSLVYILNGRLQRGKYEASLAVISPSELRKIELIKPRILAEKFGVRSRWPAVSIVADTPVKEL